MAFEGPEKFVCQIYGAEGGDTVYEAKLTFLRGKQLEKLLPTSEALQQHVLRALADYNGAVSLPAAHHNVSPH